ncbi:MAG: TetR/AcrR family transcriptional regulator [Rhodococcus sp.]|nr:TetR/AcrR family transcriptional regulator [Rhodococcus sp. (in: high G+C Gram-positive bacteria)]
MVAGAADVLRRRGLHATSVRDLAKHSGSPLGSTYHYFPGGKTQLAAEAVRFADELTAAALADELQAGPVAGLRAFTAMWRSILVDSNFQAGCPVLAVSIEDQPEGNDEPRTAAAAAFDNWAGLLSEALRAHGAGADVAQQSATLIVASLEGAVAMCRADRSTDALDRTARALESVVQGVTAEDHATG